MQNNKKPFFSAQVRLDDFAPASENEKAYMVKMRPSTTFFKDGMKRLLKNPIATISMIVIILVTLASIVLPMFWPYGYEQQLGNQPFKVPDKSYANLAPFEYGETEQARIEAGEKIFPHIFGTDQHGRDYFIRVIYGARISLAVGFFASLIVLVIGMTVGAVSGYLGGKVDMIIMRIVDIMIAIPYMIVVLVIQVVAGRGIGTIILALVITGWLNTARLTRGQILQLKNEDYVMAAQSLNVKGSTIIMRHLLPNILSVILVSVTMAIPSAMFSEAFLSFIGMGTSDVSWGSLIRTGMDVRALAPWQLFWPSILLAATMLCIQLLGDSLRDALDPKLRR